MRSGVDDAGPRVQTIFARGISARSRASNRLAENARTPVITARRCGSRCLACVVVVAAMSGGVHRSIEPQPNLVGPGRPPHDHPHRGHPLAVVPVQLRRRTSSTRTTACCPANGAVRRHRAHRDDGEAHPRQRRSLAVARLRRRLGGRAGVQRVQGRGRDPRAVARRHGRRGARQPRVRSRRDATCYQKIDNWSQFPHLVANYAFDDSADPTQRSLQGRRRSRTRSTTSRASRSA